jgi:hypothetical protein
MFSFLPLAHLVGQAARARIDADEAARAASCYQAGHWRRADDVIDVEAREVPEPRLIGHEGGQ